MGQWREQDFQIVNQKVSIRQEGERVLVLRNGVALFNMPWEAALEMANALTAKARLAEELVKIQEVARDQAILMRAGSPIGIINTPGGMDLAKQIATGDRDLRRFMPNHIKSEEKFGVPIVTVGEPKP